MKRFCLDFGFVFLMEDDWIIVKQHIVNTAHNVMEGAVLANGACGGPIFLSQVGRFLN